MNPRPSIGGAAFLLILLWTAASFSASDEETERAYSLNQEAMIDLSTAEFPSAARKFLEAAGIVPDYGIMGRPLRYTPTFMAAWAFEKEGLREEACRTYDRFLRIAPEDLREGTKVEHARSFLNDYCR
jgi:hypothetical protein